MKNKKIKINEYTLKNYTSLSKNEKITALKFRNDNKKWMINTNDISIEEHMLWIKNLKINNNQIYYLVFKNEIPFMSIDYHDIDYNKKEAYWGYFLGLEEYKGEVLKIEKIIIDIAFNNLGINKLLCINDINNHVINIHKFFGFIEDSVIEINDRKFLKMYKTKDK